MVNRKRDTLQVADSIEVKEIREDGILVSILSSVRMRVAVRTSILSSRWRYLWSYIPNLYFDDHNMLVKTNVDPSKLNMQEHESFLEERTYKFVRCVDDFLRHHHGVGVQTFYLSFFLHQKYVDYLDRWISFAIASGAKYLTFNMQGDFYVDIDYAISTEPYVFPCQLFADGRGSSIERICLDACSLSIPPNFDGFNSLKALHLENVNVTDSDINNLLSTSHYLESLSVTHNLSLSNLKISHPSLKHLILKSCHKLMEIECSSVNLTLFEYEGIRVSLRCRNAPRLTRACIQIRGHGYYDAVNYYLARLSYELPHLNTLIFHVGPDYEVETLPIHFNKFTHLKHLVLFVFGEIAKDLLLLSFLLNAAPFLEKFELHLGFYKPSPEERSLMRPLNPPHHHLKTIEISGFTGSTSQMEIALYMLNNATALELMTIWACRKTYEGNGKWVSSEDSTTITRENLSSIASQYLHGECPETAKLVIK